MLGTEEGSVGGDKKITLFGGGVGVDGKVLGEGLQDSLKGESFIFHFLLSIMINKLHT